MAGLQTPHEKKRWQTPTLMVLTRESAEEQDVLAECKTIHWGQKGAAYKHHTLCHYGWGSPEGCGRACSRAPTD